MTGKVVQHRVNVTSAHIIQRERAEAAKRGMKFFKSSVPSKKTGEKNPWRDVRKGSVVQAGDMANIEHTKPIQKTINEAHEQLDEPLFTTPERTKDILTALLNGKIKIEIKLVC